MAAHGIDVNYETIRCWTIKFGPQIARRLKSFALSVSTLPSRRGRLDRRKRMFRWRAVDDEGEVLDLVVQRRGDTEAALKLLRRLLRNQPVEPEKIVPDRPLHSATKDESTQGVDARPRVRVRRACPEQFAPASARASNERPTGSGSATASRTGSDVRRRLENSRCRRRRHGPSPGWRLDNPSARAVPFFQLPAAGLGRVWRTASAAFSGRM